MRPWLLLSVVVLAGCAHRPETPEPVDQAVKARYWAIQDAQRERSTSGVRRPPLHQPGRFEDGARRAPSGEEMTVTHSP